MIMEKSKNDIDESMLLESYNKSSEDIHLTDRERPSGFLSSECLPLITEEILSHRDSYTPPLLEIPSTDFEGKSPKDVVFNSFYEESSNVEQERTNAYDLQNDCDDISSPSHSPSSFVVPGKSLESKLPSLSFEVEREEENILACSDKGIKYAGDIVDSEKNEVFTREQQRFEMNEHFGKTLHSENLSIIAEEKCQEGQQFEKKHADVEANYAGNECENECGDDEMNYSTSKEYNSMDELQCFKSESSNIEEKEEGELEEGELDDEEDNEEMKSTQGSISIEITDKIEHQSADGKIENKNIFISQEKVKEGTEVKEKSSRKRSHRGIGENKKRKRRKHHRSQEDFSQENIEDCSSKSKSDTTYDYDVLLQHEIEKLVGSDSENLTESEQNRLYQLIKQCRSRDANENESIGSASGDEWEGKSRRPRRVKRNSRSPAPSRNTDQLCIYYLQGNCRRGKLCPYSHAGTPKRKMELCKFYMMDCCAKKAKCLYMHNEFPCKYFHFGMKCEAAEMCKFSHDSLEEVTKTILLKHIELAPKDILGDFPRVSKEDGDIIISVTQDKKAGLPVDTARLDSVREYEGKGFKYLDKVLKHLPKREKEKENIIDGKEDSKEKKERDDIERSPWKSRTRDKESERDRGDREKFKSNAGEQDRHLHKRESTKIPRDRERHRSRRENSPSFRRSRDISSRHSSGGNHSSGRSRDDRFVDSPKGSSKQMFVDSTRDQKKWYSSDEEDYNRNNNNNNTTRGYRTSEQSRFNQSTSESHEEEDLRYPLENDQRIKQSGDFVFQGNLPDIDVMYLKNVLSAVQNQSKNLSQLQGETTTSQNFSKTEFHNNVDNFSSISTADIKEVFKDSSDVQSSGKKPLLSTPIGVTPIPCEQLLRNRASSSDIGIDFRDNSVHDPSSSPTSSVNDPRLKSTKRHTNFDPDIDNDKGYRRATDVLSKCSNIYQNKKNIYDDSMNESARIGRRRVESRNTRQSVDDYKSSSIYSFYNDLSEDIMLSDDMLNQETSLPFKVPVHSSAKEIDASFNPQYALFYKMIEVDIPRPDFSRLRINKDDPKVMDDPRLRKMFRRRSLDQIISSPKSYDSDATPASPPDEEKMRSSREFISEPNSRDPRRKVIRDPRMDLSHSLPHLNILHQERRVDPRLAQNTFENEYKGMNRASSLSDSHLENRDPRLDMRDQVMDVDSFEPDCRARNFHLPNEVLENQDFILARDLQNMAKPGFHQGGDPRGRPGLLGPGPLPNPINLANINLQLPQTLIANPFLISQHLSNQAMAAFPFMPGNMRNNLDPAVSNFDPEQSQWNSKRTKNRDPRLK